MGVSMANGSGACDGGPGNGGTPIEVTAPNHWWVLVNGIPPR